MEYIEGITLGNIWEDLPWEERKLYINETVKYMSTLSHGLRFKRTGQLKNVDNIDIENPNTDYIEIVNDCCSQEYSTQWRDSFTSRLNEVRLNDNTR
jgi:hypothetical protein